jgi:hypothetical protein
MKFVVLVLLAAVVGSLGSALFYLARDKPGSPRTLTALKVRVALSILLILFLVLSFHFGWIRPER